MYLPLPAAFRSLSRLSSALSAKASTLRSYSLYHSVSLSSGESVSIHSVVWFLVCVCLVSVVLTTSLRITFGLFLGCLYLAF